MPLPPPLDVAYAQRSTFALAARLFQLEDASHGQLKVVRDVEELTACLRYRGRLPPRGGGSDRSGALHPRGALPSRAPLAGFGLEPAERVRGRRAVRFPAVAGYWGWVDGSRQVSRTGMQLAWHPDRPLAPQRARLLGRSGAVRCAAGGARSNVHALCPSTRNLTDRQLDVIGASGGMVGVAFDVSMVRGWASRSGHAPDRHRVPRRLPGRADRDRPCRLRLRLQWRDDATRTGGCRRPAQPAPCLAGAGV